MRVSMGDFLGGLNFLGIIIENCGFDYDQWSTVDKLLPEFVTDLQRWDQKYPGWFDEFKLAYLYAVNLADFGVEAYVQSYMDFALPEPFRDFLIYVWERLFPTEPWQRVFPTDVIVDWKV